MDDFVPRKGIVVTTNGCFDLLHPGHIESLRIAKTYGDYLIVCLNSDNSVRRLKGLERPIHDAEYRRKMLEAIRYVDEVIIFAEDDPCRILERIKPNFHIKTKSGYKGLEKDVVEKNGGKIILIDDVPGYSSTQEIYKIFKAQYEIMKNEY